MNFVQTPLAGLFEIQPQENFDSRGSFARVFCAREFQEAGLKTEVLQINHSWNRKKGTLRGLHFQFPPVCETKVVRCLHGRVFDVAVDLRRDSPTFLKWHSVILSEENRRMFLLPPGFAHGFITLEDNSQLIYLHSEFYASGHEGAFRYDEPRIGIEWPIEPTVISDRDLSHPAMEPDFQGILLDERFKG